MNNVYFGWMIFHECCFLQMTAKVCQQIDDAPSSASDVITSDTSNQKCIIYKYYNIQLHLFSFAVKSMSIAIFNEVN